MIEKLNDIENLNAFKPVDLYTIRIKSLVDTYGFGYSFAAFYRQMKQGRCTAVFSILDSDITLAVDTDSADVPELAEFFNLHGFTSLLCSAGFLLDRSFDQGTVMSSRDKKNSGNSNLTICALRSYDPLRALYDFLEYDGAFDMWYADIHRRIAKSTAKACAVFENGRMLSSALLSSVHNGCAVLSGVKTDPAYRNRGYASALVRYLCQTVPGTVYLMREHSKNEQFYLELGFKNTDQWRIYR